MSITTALLRIRCSGTTYKQCSSMRKALFEKNKNNLVDLYLVADRKANHGFCMIGNVTGTKDQIKSIKQDLIQTNSAKIEEIKVVYGI